MLLSPLLRRPLQSSRRRQRTSSSASSRAKTKGNKAAAAPDVSEKGIFNSFSLAEHEPSSYYSSTSLLPHEQHETPRDHDGRHQSVVGRHGRVAAASSGAAYYYDPAFDSNEGHDDEPDDNGGESSADEYQRQQRRQLLEDGMDLDAGGGPGGHYYYYPGRGRNAAQTLARNQDFGRFYGNVPAPSPYRHRHQLAFFAGGSSSPYSSSSSSSSSGRRTGAVRHGRRRSRGGLATSPFPTFSPAVAAAAAAAGAAAGVLMKITAAAGLALAVLAPLAAALSSHWAYFVAGGICAAISHTAAVPLDVIKTRIQVCESVRAARRGRRV